MPTIEIYLHHDCHLCAEALALLKTLRERLGFELREIDIMADKALLHSYFERVPVVALDGQELFEYFVDEQALCERLGRTG